MSTPRSYPAGTVRALLDTELVTPATRAALKARLTRPAVTTPRFFDDDTFAVLRAVCDRLVPQRDEDEPVDIAGAIDERLASGLCDGWRYDIMPPDGDAYRAGLRAIDAMADARHHRRFVELDSAARDDLLRDVERGERTLAWTSLSPHRFFEELLAEAVESFYSHPFAQEDIGFVGMASAAGWQAIRLGEREAHEPSEGPHDV